MTPAATRTRTRSGSPRSPRTVLAVAVLGGAVLAGPLAACGSSSGASGSSSARSDLAMASPGQVPGASSPAAGGAVPKAAGTEHSTVADAQSALLSEPRLVRTGGLTVRVPDVTRAAARVRALTAASGGYVGDEQTSTAGPGADATSTMQLRVPQSDLGSLTNQVAALGSVTDRSETSEDVTQKTVDVASRLATQKASVARVRALLARATKISDVVLIEGELSTRESSLESLEAQLKSLNDSVDLATLNVELTARSAVTHHATTSTGFLPGLRRGWDAFSGAVVVALTGLGAVLPFAALVALVGGPALLVWRRRRHSVPVAAQPVTAPDA